MPTPIIYILLSCTSYCHTCVTSNNAVQLAHIHRFLQVTSDDSLHLKRSANSKYNIKGSHIANITSNYPVTLLLLKTKRLNTNKNHDQLRIRYHGSRELKNLFSISDAW